MHDCVSVYMHIVIHFFFLHVQILNCKTQSGTRLLSKFYTILYYNYKFSAPFCLTWLSPLGVYIHVFKKSSTFEFSVAGI